MNQNYPTFRGLLRSAICTRTQAQFANDSHISAEHLSRMLNLDTIHRPNNATLHKIASAAKNGITYQDLVDALDTDDGTVRTPKTSDECHEPKISSEEEMKDAFRKNASACMEKLKAQIETAEYPAMQKSIADYVAVLIQDCNNADIPLQIAYDIGQSRPYIGTLHKYASMYAPVYLSMADFRHTATSRMIVYFTEVPAHDNKKQYVIQGTCMSVKDIEDLYGMPPAAMDGIEDDGDGTEALEKAYLLPWYLDFELTERYHERYVPLDEPNTNKRIIESIFGTQFKRPMSYYGTGFTIQEPPERLAKFLNDHKIHVLSQLDSMPDRRKELEKALPECADSSNNQGIADILNEMEYIDENCDSDEGWQAAVAAVMSMETGFPFKYHEASVSEEPGLCLSREGCIIVSEEDVLEHDIRRETLLNAICRYARALGIKTFGDIMHTNLRTWYNKPITYNVKEDTGEADDTEPETKIEYSVPFTKDGQHPDKTGIYPVELKDGRRMMILFLKEHDNWIMNHKEWSHMIAAYSPDMIEISAKTE